MSTAETASPLVSKAKTPRRGKGASIVEVESKARKLLLSGGGLLCFGLGMVGVGSADAGSIVTLLGLGVLIYGIHTFGRLGPDDTV